MSSNSIHSNKLLGNITWKKIQNMNSLLVAISALVKSNVGEKCLVSFLMNVSALALRDYLQLTDIYKRNGTKK